MKKINSNIISSNVVQEVPTLTPDLVERPQILHGVTYKVKTPLSEHALYVTINDIEENGRKRPFEIFINSKNTESFQWIVALTRLMSAVFRNSTDVSFMVEELESVFDPNGGMMVKGRGYVPSLVSEIGYCVKNHLVALGYIKSFEEVAEIQQMKCPKCHENKLIRQEGCNKCLNCDYSQCG